MSRITVCLSYFNQPARSLKRHLRMWRKYPKKIKDAFTFFIIDDCSKKSVDKILTADDLSGLDVHLYRVTKDLRYNIAGVRNLGAMECKTPWMIILDMDTFIDEDCAKSIVKLAQKEINNKKAFRFNRKVTQKTKYTAVSKIKEGVIHPAVCLIQKKDYWDIGGCEEDLVGHYGHTDPSFWGRAREKIKIIDCGKIYLDYLQSALGPRDTSHNQRLSSQHGRDNSWSTDFVRFPWKKIS